MVRLTIVAESSIGVTLNVEGHILSDSCSLLEAECLRHLARGCKVVLDCAGVTLIDARGTEVLSGLKARDVELINCWPRIEEPIAEGDGP